MIYSLQVKDLELIILKHYVYKYVSKLNEVKDQVLQGLWTCRNCFACLIGRVETRGMLVGCYL